MELSDTQWQEAREDAAILEAKVAAIVEEFEQKHHPIQVNILTRYRNFKHLYAMAKGGAAQVVLMDTSHTGNIGPSVIHSARLMKPIVDIIYSDAE